MGDATGAHVCLNNGLLTLERIWMPMCGRYPADLTSNASAEHVT